MARRFSTIRVTHRYGAPAERVFNAWLDPAAARRWLFATASRPLARVAIDARVDGSFRFVDGADATAVEYAGTYLDITPPRRLVFTLSEDGRRTDASRVTVEVSPMKKGSTVRLTQEKVPVEHAGRAAGRWSGILYGLGVTLADMPDSAVAGQR